MSAATLTAREVQPLHVFAWIVDSGLRDSLKALGHAILRRVDRHSWRWPRRHGAPGGVTVEDLADGAGLSRRHAARCLRHLEDLGLVRTTFRPFEVSEYQLDVDAWRHRAESHRQRRRAHKQRTREDRIAAFQERRAQVLGRRSAQAPAAAPAPAREARPTVRPAAPPTEPAWAARHARRLHAAPATVFALVGGAAAAVLGDGVEREAQGGLARPVLRLWEARGRPAVDALVDELSLIARWARESVHPEAVGLRGQGRRGDGVDRSRDARAVCDAHRFEQRLALARAHARAAGGWAPPASPASLSVAPSAADPPPPSAQAPPEPALPRLGEPPWVVPGQPSFLPGIGPRAEALVDAWQVALDRLRGSEEHDRGAIDIFLAPLRPVALQDGVAVLAAPSADCARWIGRHLTAELAELSQSIGAPLGLVVDPGAAG